MIPREKNPDYINSFLDYSITILNKSPNSVKEYNYDLTNFFRFIMIRFNMTNEEDPEKIDITKFTKDDLRKITLEDIHSYISHLAIDNRAKATTRARKISTLRIFFKYATVKEKLLDVNPAQNLETPKLEKRMPKYLSLEQSQKLLKVADSTDNRNYKRDFAITTLFLNCGMRLSELVGINIRDIDFDENKMTVIGKGNKERIIYLNDACVNAYNDYLNLSETDNEKRSAAGNRNMTAKTDALFLSRRNTRISNRRVQQIVEECLKASGLDNRGLSVHKLRHTAATLMYQNGVDVRVLKEVLGHENLNTTQIYTHVSNEQLENAMNRNPLAELSNKKDK